MVPILSYALFSVVDPYDFWPPSPDPDPSINKQKSYKKTWFLLFVTSFLTFIYKDWCKCTLKGTVISKNKTFWKLISCWHLVRRIWRPDPEVSGPDPRIRIRTKMPRILNTAPFFTVFTCISLWAVTLFHCEHRSWQFSFAVLQNLSW